MNPILLVLSGPAGSGKSTLCDRLVEERPDFSRVVTATTRSPRGGEIDGTHYHFLTPSKFKEMVKAGMFLEWCYVHGEDENRMYGTPKSSALAPLQAGRNLVMNIDVQGADKLRIAAREDPLISRCLLTGFIKGEPEKLLGRMISRAKDDPREMARRIETAYAELKEAGKFDFVIETTTRESDFEALLARLPKAA